MLTYIQTMLAITIFQLGLQPSFTHQLNCVCVNFIHEWRDPQFNTNSERQTFEKLFMAILIVLSTFDRNLLKGSR